MAGKILVIDSVMPNRIILKVKLSGAGYNVLIAGSGREGLELAFHERPDLVIIDMDLPDLPAEVVMTKLQSVAGLEDALVIMASSQSDLETRLRAFAAGADDFLAKPFVESMLLARIRSLFRADEQLRQLSDQSDAQLAHDIAHEGFADPTLTFTMPGRILIIGEAKAALGLKRKLPEQENIETILCTPEAAINSNPLPFEDCDIVLIMFDPRDPNQAFRLIATLLLRPPTRDARFCLHFDMDSRATDRELAYDIGADAIFMADDDAREIGLRLKGLLKRKHRADALRERITMGLTLAMKDPLTNIPNRRYMFAVMRSFIKKARKTQSSIAVIICDIDRFKSVNDNFGHAAGDDVLREVAARLSSALREGDLIARIGGEEFLVALPNATMGDARMVAERLVNVVAAKPIAVDRAPPLNITISAGLALAQPDMNTLVDDVISHTLEVADFAMLQSKANGRNRITYGRSAA